MLFFNFCPLCLDSLSLYGREQLSCQTTWACVNDDNILVCIVLSPKAVESVKCIQRKCLVYFKWGAGHRSRWQNLLGIRGNVLRKGNKKTICLKFWHLLTVKLDFWATGALQRLQQMLFIMEVLTSLPNGNLISVLQMLWEGLDCTLRSFFDIKDNTLLWK